jgi:hypothetical protein
MAKMFYSLEEVMELLMMSEDQVRGLVRSGQLREFRDAGKVNYNADEVDALASLSGSTGASASGELVLEPADDTGAGASGIDLASSTGLGSDILTLEDTDVDSSGTRVGDEPKKDDTVVSSVGVNVFDEDDEDLQDVDPLAQTVVTEGAAGLGIEGIGSGSGLLDLTRESDDTSLGADLLDEIYPEDEAGEVGDATRAGVAAELPDEDDDLVPSEEIFEAPPMTRGGTVAGAPGAAPVRTRTRTVVEYGQDAWSTGLSGMMVVATAVMCIAGLSAAATIRGVWPSLLQTLSDNMMIFGGVCLGLAIIALLVGFFIGKRSEG